MNTNVTILLSYLPRDVLMAVFYRGQSSSCIDDRRLKFVAGNNVITTSQNANSLSRADLCLRANSGARTLARFLTM
jgi:hypothetical protein